MCAGDLASLLKYEMRPYTGDALHQSAAHTLNTGRVRYSSTHLLGSKMTAPKSRQDCLH